MVMSEVRVREIAAGLIEQDNARVESQVGTIMAGVKQELSELITKQIARAETLSEQLTRQSETITNACMQAHSRLDQQVIEGNTMKEQLVEEFKNVRKEFDTLRGALGQKFQDIDAKDIDLRERFKGFNTQVESQR